jgi:ATP-dependent DNA helicase HFM1/MER3
VRLKQNPNHYRLKQKEGAQIWDEHDLLQQICDKDLKLLQSIDLVSSDGGLKCTELGDAMARYYVKFETMKTVLSLPPKAKMSEIVSYCSFSLDIEAHVLHLAVVDSSASGRIP